MSNNKGRYIVSQGTLPPHSDLSKMASHMLRRLNKNAFATAFLRTQAVRLVSTTSRVTLAVNRCSQQPSVFNHGLFLSRLSPVNARCFASAGMSVSELEDRVLNVVKLFDKVNAELVSMN